jgi:hypothetical protein
MAEQGLSREAAQAIFKEFDADNSGSIDAAEFQVVANALGNTLTDEQAAAALEKLDTDGNGTVDFDEFFAWMNDANGVDGGEQNVSTWETALVRSKLTARYYRTIANNRLASAKKMFSGAEKKEGFLGINVGVSIGEPAEDGSAIEFSKTDGEEGNYVALFITLREGAEKVDELIELLNNILGTLPLAEAPGFKDFSVTRSDFNGSSAICIQFNNHIDPFDMIAQQSPLDPRDIRFNAVRSKFGCSLIDVLRGEKSPADFLSGYEAEINIQVPNDMKTLVQQMRGPNQVALRMFSVMRAVNFKIEYDNAAEALDEYFKTIGQEGKGMSYALNTKFTGFESLLASALKFLLENVLPNGPIPFGNQIVENFESFEGLKGIGGLRLNFNGHQYNLTLTNFDFFSLIPGAEAREGAIPFNPDPLRFELYSPEVKQFIDIMRGRAGAEDEAPQWQSINEGAGV